MTRSASSKPVVLTLCDYYLPGTKAGGPIASIRNLTTALGSEYDFRVVTRDRDFGDTSPYSDISTDSWNNTLGVQVHYLPPGAAALTRLSHLLRTVDYDTLYLNSLFSPNFSAFPLLLRRLGTIPRCDVVLAPRGELSPGAMGIKSQKKRLFLQLVKLAKLHRNITWQATSFLEEEDIRRHFGQYAKVIVAPNFASSEGEAVSCQIGQKVRGHLKLLFLSRINPKKNLDFALSLLSDLRGTIEMNIVGPCEDRAYWSDCKSIIESLPSNITVNFLGSVPPSEVSGIMGEHDLFLLPTRGENFGHVIVESLTAGCPVLISDQTPWRNLANVSAGWDIPLSEPSLYHSVLQEVIDSDEQTHREWREKARLHGMQIVHDESIVRSNREMFHRAA